MLVRRAVWIILIGVVVAVAGAVAGLTGVRLDADTDSLISPDRPFMQDYQAFKDRFGDLERIWVVVDAHGNESQARSAIDWIEPQLRTLDLPQIVARIDSQEQARLTTWTAPPESVEAIASACAILSLAKDGPDAFLNAAASSLESATSPAGGDLDQRETEVRAAVSALSMLTDAELVPTDQLLTSPSGELHFIGILPHKDYGTLSVVEAPLARIRAVLESA